METYRLGFLIGIPGVLLLPLVRLTLPNNVLMWSLIVLCCFLRSLSGQFTFSSVFALVANSVTPELLGSGIQKLIHIASM